jgi:cbb3-type cytochrome oxidase subunit 3
VRKSRIIELSIHDMQQVVRIIAVVVLAVLLIFYTWFTFRADGRLMTVPGVPHTVWYYFDHHSNVRNAVGFAVLAAVSAVACSSVAKKWKVIFLTLCLATPVLKDPA